MSFIVKSLIITLFIVFLFLLTIFRSHSKNFARRRRENQLYEQAAKPVKRFFKYWFTRIKSHKTHRIYVCTKCGGFLRVPKSAWAYNPSEGGQRGGRVKRLEIKCPKCGASFSQRLSGEKNNGNIGYKNGGKIDGNNDG
jgi:DNA-directed RNA polymerase subunit RPC12/RpoP